MDEHQLFIQVDPTLTYSINTQVKEQLKWLIGIGQIQSGELLPPAVQLAEQLGLNRNTINAVYIQLKDEGIVSIQKGKGTEVQHNEQVRKLKQNRVVMYELLNSMSNEACERQLDIRELAVAGLAYTQLFQLPVRQVPEVLFIECKEHDYDFYEQEIVRITGARTSTLYLEDIKYSPSLLEESLSRAQYVVTTLNHEQEVQALIGDKHELIVLGAAVEFNALLDLSKLQAGTKVGFVCLGLKGGQWMAAKAEEAGIDHIVTIPLGIDHPDSLRQFIAQSSSENCRLYASQAVYSKVQAAAPDLTVNYPMRLEASSESLLQSIRKVE
ncbi:winged helix-turn-helix domain-containing protein [Paenibacillus sp. UMB4589-SE434]|uniref:GntR family transcriptional regulator n=1 Tax=Paenibacillus sp. UMB4589-SE434 TaxID=3046314 RepID=UPI00254D9502|nr:winged helix-turn-helix domain-containing protein [Paenibacillus sp. UMB4589-SE434]MDK8182214.1 winged helix-turn-helix domain-containing protein [Paenibacillus sp. UMB4589-SE434]